LSQVVAEVVVVIEAVAVVQVVYAQQLLQQVVVDL
jgi:hypothetical protein